jgi:AcrR family transcriptional regulator
MREPAADTSQRLLDAAEGLFADRGYDGVSIRDIAAAAGVNVAAINYHFGGKERLYQVILERVMTAKRDRYLAALRAPRKASDEGLEDLLRAFFRTHFDDTLKSERGASFIKLLVRELHEGSRERRQIIQEQLAPLWTEFGQALREVVPGLDEAAAAWVAGSLHGQLVHFTMRWHRAPAPLAGGDQPHLVQALFPPLAEDVDRYIEQAVAHIVRFAAAGIRAVAGGRPAKEPS